MIPTLGLRVGAGACLDVPVVFAPETMKPQQAWLYITLQPLLQSPEPSAASHQPDSTRWGDVDETQTQILPKINLVDFTLILLFKSLWHQRQKLMRLLHNNTSKINYKG